MSGSISIPNYPANNRVPGFYFALDATKANTATPGRRVLAIGQMTGGAAQPNVAAISAGLADAQGKYGASSQCAHAVKRYRQIDTVGELWVLPLADDTAAKAATGGFVVTGTAAVAGTIPFYVGDRLVPVPVNAGDGGATITANQVAKAATMPDLGVTFAVSSNPIASTITAANKGLSGNDIQLGVALLGAAGGESIPAGLTVTISPMAGGTQNPTTLAAALAALGDKSFDLIFHPYNDTASLNVIQAFLSDTAGRWRPTNQQFGHGITAVRGTLGTVTAFGVTRNDQHHSIMPISDSPSSPLAWAAQLAAQAAVSMRDNPARPIADLALAVLPPSLTGRFTFDQRESLLFDGLSTHRVDDSGTVWIERLTTTYQTNALGAPDDSYLDIETLLTLQVAIQDMKTFFGTQFSRMILVDDAAKITAGQPATNSKLARAAIVSRYRYQCAQLWCQDADGFAAAVVVRNAGGGVLQCLLPFRIANQLRVVACNVQFTKP
ncbi:phage tail sheath subtilisin-like domain-containing protein [Rhizosaccharibacter radicis]|uniref:Phage tail sheath subtilisin-like domain-containing protein n=1 Tax=Rhizosaccharibacter radicis TaxID=2782605 RepID=A0ABT1VW05_9PROT|nr:phage tail sheath subtilisin-like domain-containing protein [Acetobacteraceae bacterium KSS12]